MIRLDGSVGEGGGQILRTALSVAAVTGEGVEIRNVRSGRPKPGLAPQHLAAVRSLAAVCQARVTGDQLGSQLVKFEPTSAPVAGEYRVNVEEFADGGSAGSVSLLAQALLIPLAFCEAGSRLALLGGTHVAWSPPFEYLSTVYLPALAECGIHAEANLKAWGFYPAGGGRIEASVQGSAARSLWPLDLTAPGELLAIKGVAVACNLPAHIPQRMTDRARSRLKPLDVPFALEPRRVRGRGPGAAIVVIAEYERIRAGFSAYGRRGKPSEALADEACDRLLDHHRSGAAVDPHLADQLLLPASLAAGRSAFTTSQASGHLETLRLILPPLTGARIETAGLDHGLVEVVVEGSPPSGRPA